LVGPREETAKAGTARDLLAVSAVCLIVPPTIAAVVAVAVFAYSAIRREA
jgi:hypothetical protein